MDRQRRKRVMSRSMQLGHCVCNPKQPCPCDTLREYNVCPCAGEKLPSAILPEASSNGSIRLTQLVEKPGCASKISAGLLGRVLGTLPTPEYPNVMIGMPAGDDAGVVRIDEKNAIVQTVDVFTPSVDDPYQFGQIAAANSVSDVYAMGGRPISALSIIGFPTDSVPEEVFREILRGGIEKMDEAGVPVVGGHSINDPQVKAGFAVTGMIETDQVFTNATIRPGDRLILTKPLGTGILAFGSQIDRVRSESLDAAARSMARLNADAARLMKQFSAHAATDITGFGLFGHLVKMARAASLKIQIEWDRLPVLPEVLECLAAGIISGGTERNRESFETEVVAGDGVSDAMLDLCYDPQTSGGLLIAVPPSRAEALLEGLHEAGDVAACDIGCVSDEPAGKVVLSTTGQRVLPSRKDQAPVEPEKSDIPGQASSGSLECCCGEPVAAASEEMACCGGDACCADAGSDETAGAVSELESAFLAFLEAGKAPGLLGSKAKKAIAIALSVYAKCEPCVKMHIKSAREMGFTQEEIDEAAWLAISFGGSPIWAFYQQWRKRV